MRELSNVSNKRTVTDQLRTFAKSVIDPTVRVLCRVGVTPNMLTIIGMLIHIPVAWALVQGRFRLAAAFGLLSMFDALDGSLARLNPNHNPNGFGAFLDSTVDRISELLIFGGMATWFFLQGQLLYVLLSIMALGGSLMVSYTRARAEALGIACKIGLLTRVERYLLLFIFGMANQPEWLLIALAIGTWFTVGQRVWAVWRATSDK